MANMGYCRFRNTLKDVQDCISALHSNTELSEEEYAAMEEMVEALQELEELSENVTTRSSDEDDD